ncbi:hypothetical protein LOK49_LG07G00060 [Camellia lanceoleosa]|uniref:Uncharacterized protein n=1 Tax=Camellia lanceoleosa TaxID=1840588 RepID=A0ACC0H1I7_9ERIC|nr:hypothetical protein LOK49_LG07G00060 [Camellia lanceoleosa]
MANQERNTEATDDAMSPSLDYNLYLPMDIIFDILNRLPVKSLLRFRARFFSVLHRDFCPLETNGLENGDEPAAIWICEKNPLAEGLSTSTSVVADSEEAFPDVDDDDDELDLDELNELEASLSRTSIRIQEPDVEILS